MNLGKRYIALLPAMERDPDGAVVRDDQGRISYSGYRLHHNERLYEQKHRARIEANRYGQKPHNMGFGHVLIVDLDLLPFIDESPVAQYEHAERLMLHWTAEEERLRVALGGHMPKQPAADISCLKLLHNQAVKWAAIRPWLWNGDADPTLARSRTDSEMYSMLCRVFPKLDDEAKEHRAKVVLSP